MPPDGARTEDALTVRPPHPLVTEPVATIEQSDQAAEGMPDALAYQDTDPTLGRLKT